MKTLQSFETSITIYMSRRRNATEDLNPLINHHTIESHCLLSSTDSAVQNTIKNMDANKYTVLPLFTQGRAQLLALYSLFTQLCMLHIRALEDLVWRVRKIPKKETTSFVMFARPHGATRLPLDGLP